MSLYVEHDGRKIPVRLEDCNAIEARDVRKATGVSLQQIMAVARDGSVDLEVVATLVWLARRHDGEKSLSWEDVAESISISNPAKVGVDDVEADPDPET